MRQGGGNQHGKNSKPINACTSTQKRRGNSEQDAGTQRGEASRQKFVRWGTNAGKSNEETVPKASGAGLEMQRKGAVVTGPAPRTSPSKGTTCRTAGKRV